MPPSNTPVDTPLEDTSLEATTITATPYLEQFAELASPVPDLAATLTTQAEQDANDDNVSFLRAPSSVSRTSLEGATDSLPQLSMTSRAMWTAGTEGVRRTLEAAERRRRYTPSQLHELGESNNSSNINQTADYPRHYEWEDEGSDYGQTDSDVYGLVQSSAALHDRQLDTVLEARRGSSSDPRSDFYALPYISESSARSAQSVRRISQSSRSRNRIQNYGINREPDRSSHNTVDGERSRSQMQNYITNRETDGYSQSTGGGENSSSTRVTRANSINSVSRQSLQSQQNRQRQTQEIRYQFLSVTQQQQQHHQQQQLLRQLHQQRQQPSHHHHQHQHQHQHQNQHQHQHQHHRNHSHDHEQQRAHERQFWAQQQSRPTRLPAETQRQRYFRNSVGPPSSTRSLDDAIKYLERLRFCESIQDSLSSAKAGGFGQDEFSAGTDFILDTTEIEPPPESSWLKIGGVLSGSQHAAVGSNLSSSGINYHRLPNVSNLLHHGLPMPATSASSGQITFDQSSRTSHTHTSGHMNSEGDEKWPVKVTIHSINYNSMTLAGTMEAFNVPDKSSPTNESSITTFLEGEIIDFNIHTLETKSFNANARVDGTYWRKLEPFKKLTDDEIVRALLSKKWLTEELSKKWILMRWKERCFVTPSDAQSSLTISGFYYVSLRREDGHVEGLYYDPSSTPYQHLSLMPEKRTFPAYQFQ